MKYTFLLPAYKARYLKEALDSIQRQTFRDFSVLISDDCSPENLYSIVQPYLLDSRFSYRKNEKNLGGESLVAHWNLLVGLCESEFLIMASDDDIYAPNFLEELDKLNQKYPRADLLHARAQVIDEFGEITSCDAMYEECVSQVKFLSFLGDQDHIECVPNYVYRTSHLKDMGGFVDFPLAWCSDTATNNLMASNGCATSHDILFSFRMSGQNISSINKANAKVEVKKLEAAYKFYLHIEQLFSKIPRGKTKLEQHLWTKAYNAQMHVAMISLHYFSTVLDFGKLLRLIKFMSQHQMIHTRYEKFKLISKWLYAKRHG